MSYSPTGPFQAGGAPGIDHEFLNNVEEELVAGPVPVGGIIMFSGDVGSLSTSWALCDGSNGTPDLRGRFVVGAGGGYSQGDTGGADEVTLTEQQLASHSHTAPEHSHGTGSLSIGSSGSHSHTYRTRGPFEEVEHGHPTANRLSRGSAAEANNQYIANDSGAINSAGAHTHSLSGSTSSAGGSSTSSTGGGAPHENRPPYYALAFIMRVA